MKPKRITEYIIDWLRSYAVDSGMGGFVVGVSGGIDSALTSTLCAETGLPTILVSMPIHQSSSQLDRATDHISWLTTNYSNSTNYTVELSNTFDLFEKSLPNEIVDELTMANSRARLRMAALYAFAGNKKYLVAGTGNKVEDFGVGFFTKYGDGGVDLSPIADLVKSEVGLCAEALGISKEIVNAKPTDGLWGDDRSDEDQLGASYPELEWAMGFEGDESGLTLREKEVLSIYRRLNKANQHKMNPIPICVIPSDLKH
jgi:NAD+ synthase